MANKFIITQPAIQVKECEDPSCSSSKDFSFSENSFNSPLNFPNVSISVNSSEDSSELENIKTKNSEIVHALSGRISELRKNSNQFLECLDGQPLNTEDSRNQHCFSSAARTVGVSLAEKEKSGFVKEYICKIKALRKKLSYSRQCLDNGLESIKKISSENEELQVRLEEISCRLDGSGINNEGKGFGCSCIVF